MKVTGSRGRGPPELGVAVFAAEAGGVEDQVVGDQSLHGVDRLLAGRTHLLLRLEAEGLTTHTQRHDEGLSQEAGSTVRTRQEVGPTLDRWTGFSSVLLLVAWWRNNNKLYI